MSARNDEVLLARMHRIHRVGGDTTHFAHKVFAWRNYGIVCPGYTTTNGSPVMATAVFAEAFLHNQSETFLMRFESCHPLVPAYPNALIDVWQGFLDAYYAEFPEEARYAGNMVERRRRVETNLAAYLRGSLE